MKIYIPMTTKEKEESEGNTRKKRDTGKLQYL